MMRGGLALVGFVFLAVSTVAGCSNPPAGGGSGGAHGGTGGAGTGGHSGSGGKGSGGSGSGGFHGGSGGAGSGGVGGGSGGRSGSGGNVDGGAPDGATPDGSADAGELTCTLPRGPDSEPGFTCTVFCGDLISMCANSASAAFANKAECISTCNTTFTEVQLCCRVAHLMNAPQAVFCKDALGLGACP